MVTVYGSLERNDHRDNTNQLLMPPIYGQVVVGPPGSGKTTYCDGMQQYLRLLGRDAWVINLDPANEGEGDSSGGTNPDETIMAEPKGEAPPATLNLPYETLYDVCEHAVHLTAVMKETGLGPNGGLVFCMEYLEAHADEMIQVIQNRLQEHVTSSTITTTTTNRPYLLIDLPGQVELYTHSTCVQHILQKLTKALDVRLTAVQLVDAHYCTDASKFLSAALLGTTTMIRLELPTVNVLSKVDLLLTSYGGEESLPMTLQYFTECHDLDRLLPFLDNPQRRVSSSKHADREYNEDDDDDDIEFVIADDPDYQRARQKRQNSRLQRKFTKLHQSLAEVVEDFGLLSFLPLDISSAESVGRVLAKIDKSNGYVFLATSSATTTTSDKAGTGNNYQDLFQCAIQADYQQHPQDYLADVHERLVASSSSSTPLAEGPSQNGHT